MDVLVFDNYDSFTYNLVQMIEQILDKRIQVSYNDRLDLKEIQRFDRIILSPGPGLPRQAGLLLDLIKAYAHQVPILGVCLGQQAIAEAFGGSLVNLPQIYHGVASKIQLTSPSILFRGLENQSLEVGRYHSWAVNSKGFPDVLQVTSTDEEGIIMSLQHRHFPLYGVQFHPESILTPHGRQILTNFLHLSSSKE